VFADLGKAVHAGLLPESALISDVGSVKRQVIAAAREGLGEAVARFVPGHPIAGDERRGPVAARSNLFERHRVLLTPLAENPPEAVERIARLWRVAGALVETMDAEHHDHVLAATSHLPHLLSFLLVERLARLAERREVFRYAAGGFRDFTRIAASDPALWRDIVLANRDELLRLIADYRDGLDVLARALSEDDGEVLLACFGRAKSARDRVFPPV